MINKVLHEGWTKDRVSLEYGLPSRTILLNWLAQYRKNGYTIVEKTRGRVPESGECHPKKVKRTPIEGGKRERRKTEIVQELMTEFSLDLLLKSIKLARSTYYYHLKQLDKTDKDQELKAEIQSIFIEHKGNYAYRRIYLELRNRGYLVNHKRVQHLMKYSIYKLKRDRNENILLIKETLARRQRISFKANLKALKQWNSATQM
ncbi:transposase InsK for insertion sequence [Streptococcus pneumoniae]|nr:transposase InsK for insertion sequence [Streptococcus pneumoniae]